MRQKEAIRIRPVKDFEWSCRLFSDQDIDGIEGKLDIDCPFCRYHNWSNQISWRKKSKVPDTQIPICCYACGNFFEIKDGQYYGPSFGYEE